MSDNLTMKSSREENLDDSLTVTGLKLVQLRWWLLGGLASAVLAAPTFLGIALPWPLLLGVLTLLAGFNLIVRRRIADASFGPAELTGQLMVDLVGMGVLLYLSGGATNPFVSLMLLPVAVASLSLPARSAAGIAALAIGLYSLLMLYSLPLPIADVERATRLHLGGMWLTFVVSAALIAWFVTRMTASIRLRDRQLAVAREQALRDAQVVALGQLAAGAAHELGTPLATIKVLAGELARDDRLPVDAREDIALLQRQVDACKDIVSGMVQRAGIDRAGNTNALPLPAWLDALLARWRTLWPQATCILDIRQPGDAPRVATVAVIEQAVFNLLNNAAKISPHGIRLVTDWDEGSLRIAVHDRGPGFPPEILQRCGAEPLPAQACGTGAGIGLWLTRAAIERFGGRLRLENAGAGAVATIELPLDSVSAETDSKGKGA